MSGCAAGPRCHDCSATQILLPTELIARRADSSEAIGNALAAILRFLGDRGRVNRAVPVNPAGSAHSAAHPVCGRPIDAAERCSCGLGA